MSKLTREAFNQLCAPGSRLSWLREWLLECVWTRERYECMSPVAFLEQGEREVNEVEEVIAASAPRVYDELIGTVPPENDIRLFMEQRRPCAVVVFDGLSLRELPLLLRLAEQSRLRQAESTNFTFSAIPSETNDFIEQRMGMARMSPSALPDRKSGVRDLGIAAYYYDSPSRRHALDNSAEVLLLWSSFPDNTYKDAGARFPQHFEQMHTLLETAWKNTVQTILSGRTILVTSDHGYVYFGHGMAMPRANTDVRSLTRYLGGERFARIGADGAPPDHDDLLVLRERDVAVIRGRVQTHPPGGGANILYKHCGLSLMEVLLPWVVLQRERDD